MNVNVNGRSRLAHFHGAVFGEGGPGEGGRIEGGRGEGGRRECGR